jgi:hypothetical protein
VLLVAAAAQILATSMRSEAGTTCSGAKQKMEQSEQAKTGKAPKAKDVFAVSCERINSQCVLHSCSKTNCSGLAMHSVEFQSERSDSGGGVSPFFCDMKIVGRCVPPSMLIWLAPII